MRNHCDTCETLVNRQTTVYFECSERKICAAAALPAVAFILMLDGLGLFNAFYLSLAGSPRSLTSPRLPCSPSFSAQSDLKRRSACSALPAHPTCQHSHLCEESKQLYLRPSSPPSQPHHQVSETRPHSMHFGPSFTSFLLHHCSSKLTWSEARSKEPPPLDFQEHRVVCYLLNSNILLRFVAEFFRKGATYLCLPLLLFREIAGIVMRRKNDPDCCPAHTVKLVQSNCTC